MIIFVVLPAIAVLPTWIAELAFQVGRTERRTSQRVLVAMNTKLLHYEVVNTSRMSYKLFRQELAV
jgi:hypothetical protein